MNSKESVHQLMREIGPLLDLREVSAFEERDAWLVAFEAGPVFEIDYDAGLNRVVITAVVAEVAEHARLRIYEILLQYNYVWTETGGVRMALDGSPGKVVMMFELPAAELHLSMLAEVLTNLAQIRGAWCQVLHEPGDASCPSR